MKDEREKIDFLLRRNTTKQLEKVDWDKLNTAISKKLDEAEGNKLYAKKYTALFRIAAGIAAAAVIIFIAVTVKTEPPRTAKFEYHGNAVVTLIDKKGTAATNIKQAHSRSQIIISFDDNSRKLAKCDIKITDSNGDLKKDSDQPMWIIISKSEQTVADNGYNGNEEELDLICLM
jgi:hypothetical protein